MIHIELQPELEARYAALAGERGLPLEQYIVERLQTLEPSAPPKPPKPNMTPEERAADIDAWLKRLRKHSHKIPPGLYDEETFDREFIYGDHA